MSASAANCPRCGHDASRNPYAGPMACLSVGTILTLPIVTAVLGVPMLVVGGLWLLFAWRRAGRTTPIERTADERSSR